MTDPLILNTTFKANSLIQKLIPIDDPSKKSEKTDKAVELVNQNIESERSFAIQASIVRIMKGKRTETHNNLIAGLKQQITLFTPTVELIKKNIEKLIGDD